MRKMSLFLVVLGGLVVVASILLLISVPDPIDEAEDIMRETGVEGGLVVHLGCGDGRLTAALHLNDRYQVQGLDMDPGSVGKARQNILSAGLYGQVSVDLLMGEQLPYVDNLVNLLISEDLGSVPFEEVQRVLCPSGVAYLKQEGSWKKSVKTRPTDIDEWTHYLYGPEGNPVSHDLRVGPPRGLQWMGSRRWSRHHDHMSSLSALVSAGGRIFYIMDQGPAVSIELPSSWELVARDAFNGTILWKRPIGEWHPRLWPLKSGPAQLPRRLVAEGDSVYATLGMHESLSRLDAATGEVLRVFEGTKGTQEVVLSDGILFLVVDEHTREITYESTQDYRRWYNEDFWLGEEAKIVAVEAQSGIILWESKRRVLPVTMAVDSRGLYFHDGSKVVALDRGSGDQIWQSEPVERSPIMRAFFAPTLVVHDGVILFAGGQEAGKQTGSWDISADSMIALSAETGEVLWASSHPSSGYRSPEDIFVVDNVVWVGDTLSGRAAGEMTGRDLQTGEIVSQISPDIDTYWFHHRCYRSKATDRFLLTSRTGIEFVDTDTGKWQPHHWVRGSCLYGIMPSNGLIYSPPHPCACYLEAKQSGFNALAPRSALDGISEVELESDRLVRGPAYGRGKDIETAAAENEWPTYRHDRQRSGFTRERLTGRVEPLWESPIGGQLTALTAANGMVFVAAKDRHTLYALEEHSGRIRWQFVAGGRIDSPPTLYRGLVLFGSADGWVYALRDSDGELAWRFLAAPAERRLLSFDQLESVWPVHGSLLVQENTVYALAGRSMFLDGGLRLWRLDPLSGKVLSETILDQFDERGRSIQDYVSWLNMPVALPDILSSDGRYVYMRSQPFQLDGKRLPLQESPRTEDPDRGAVLPVQQPEYAHLFSPAGFLDDSWWHRSYWLFGSKYVSGWSGYYLAGKVAPAGRILVTDEQTVYGFGRRPEYFKWTTPIEHQLFAAAKSPAVIKAKDSRGREDQRIEHTWSKEVPLLARAMLLSDDTLFLAGPPDLVDEEEAAERINDPATQARLVEQSAALDGRQGGLLWAVSATDGTKLAEYQIGAPPVFDGMAVSSGQLYLSTIDGKVLCFRGVE